MDFKTKKFIWKAQAIHYGFYDYSKSIWGVDRRTKVEIGCPIHSDFWQTPELHLRGANCPECSKNNQPLRDKKSKELMTKRANNSVDRRFKNFLIKSLLVHGIRYSYNMVNYINTHLKVEIVCLIHGPFWQFISTHLSGQGCPHCGLETIKQKSKIQNEQNKKTTEQFIEEARLIHGDRYGYSKTNHVGINDKVEIECPIHEDFWQLPNNHRKGHGCPKCSLSKGELLIENILIDLNIKFQTQRRFKQLGLLRFDFYLPNHNLCIEYDGEQHHTSVDFWGGEQTLQTIKRRDALKNQFCLDNNTKLLRIPYWVNLNEDLILSYLNEDFTVINVL